MLTEGCWFASPTEKRTAYKEEDTQQSSTRSNFSLISDGKQRVTANMRLFLAVAVLMLALVAYAEAQDDGTVEHRLTEFRDRIAEIGTNLADGARAAYEKVQNSDIVVNSKAAIADFWEKLKNRATGGSK